jgi:hypothetical protein
MELPKTKVEAIARGLTRYFTGKLCKRGHVDQRKVGSGCVECERQRKRRHYAANERERERQRVWKATNPDRVREYQRRWADENSDSNRKWLEANRDRSRENASRYAATNRGRRNANQAARDAAKIKATPSWLTKEQKAKMVDFYEQARLCTELTGVLHHVDHIEPLRGEERCGLHVPWNLQILTAAENTTKYNRPVRHFHWKKL